TPSFQPPGTSVIIDIAPAKSTAGMSRAGGRTSSAAGAGSAAPVRCRARFGPATSAFSATAAKVDPHLLMPEGAVLLVFDAAGDEVWSAVAVPVRHANAGDRLATI